MNATSPTGALLLCRAEPGAVRPVARLLRERMLLAPAGDGWSVLVPEGRTWRGGETGGTHRTHGTDGERGPSASSAAHTSYASYGERGTSGAEPVDRVVAGWAAALAVGSFWPVLAVWWDGDRAGYSLASGFRRAVGYVWFADGRPVGEDEAMRTFADRLGLDPVLDVQALDALTRPDPDADARNRLLGLLAVLGRTGLALPSGLDPGASVDRLRAVADGLPGTEPVAGAGRAETARAGLGAAGRGRIGLWAYGPGVRVLGGLQVAAGLPLVLWGAGRRSGGWTLAGALLVAHGVLGLAYGRRGGVPAGAARGTADPGRAGGVGRVGDLGDDGVPGHA